MYMCTGVYVHINVVAIRQPSVLPQVLATIFYFESGSLIALEPIM